jgi:hydrogenase maturation protease
LKILVLGIGNILFGDEGIGVHLAHYIKDKYSFVSTEHTVDVLDGGTLAQRLIPIITEYDKVVVMDCVKVLDANIGDVYNFDFQDMPEYITWSGSAHEVEMLQTLQMIDMMGDLPPIKIIGVMPYVIGENSTFTMTDAVLKASVVMEKELIKYIKSFDIVPNITNNVDLVEISKTSYLKGVL